MADKNNPVSAQAGDNQVDNLSAESKELLISCRCHGYHYFEMWADRDFGLNVTFVERPRAFRERLQAAWKALTSNDNIFDAELLVKDGDEARLVRYLTEGIDLASNNPKATEDSSNPPATNPINTEVSDAKTFNRA